jgi:hypothetical protein
MPIAPAQLVRSLGALDALAVEQGLAVTLQQVLRSAKTLLEVDRAGLMLVDLGGVLRWASASDRGVEARAGDLSAPVQVGGGPVGTLDVYVAAPRDWDDSAAGRPAGLCRAGRQPARGRGGGADHGPAGRAAAGSLGAPVVDRPCRGDPRRREGLDAPAALEWLGTAARASGCLLVQMARAVVDGAPLPSDRSVQAKAERREATDLEVAGHRRDSELHEGAARRYQRSGQPGRAQTERLQAAAARGRIIDAEAERRRADQQP